MRAKRTTQTSRFDPQAISHPVGCEFQFNVQLLSNSNSHPTPPPDDRWILRIAL